MLASEDKLDLKTMVQKIDEERFCMIDKSVFGESTLVVDT